MFEGNIYVERRKSLKEKFDSGILIFIGNEESSMNYPANTYAFRQDSTFLYFWGIDCPDLAAVIDIDQDEEILYGDDFTVDDIIWMGPQESIAEKAQSVGVNITRAMDKLEPRIKEALSKDRKVHFLPQYRPENLITLEKLTGLHHSKINASSSNKMIIEIVNLRSVKSNGEIREIETALDISYELNKIAMEMSKPGLYEREVFGAVEGIVLSSGAHVSFPIIFSIHGETLHNHFHGNKMESGDILVLDSGAESPLHYASDITRTFPVSGKFTESQKDIYNIVLKSQESAIDMMKPDILYKDVHLHTSKIIAQGMKDLGFMKGDTEEAVALGAHGLFFPHGLGHMLGLDVHDMENLGEKYVGYDDDTERSDQFGLAYLRLARKLQPGFVVTVEPGIYFIPELIDLWKSQNKHVEFINYTKVEEYRNFGGIRIEDDVLIEENGHRILGKKIAKTVDDVEAWSSR